MVKRHYQVGKKKLYFKEAYRLRQEGLSFPAISEIIGVHENTIRYWFTTFADGNNRNKRKMKEQPQDPPKSINMDELSTCSPEEQIEKLKEALRRAELRADLYDEMIKVAEAKFKIGIRKKAGAKQ